MSDFYARLALIKDRVEAGEKKVGHEAQWTGLHNDYLEDVPFLLDNLATPKVKRELISQRDALWSRALLASGLDPREMQKVLAKFNRMRKD